MIPAARFAARRTTCRCRGGCRALHGLRNRISTMVTELSGRACAKINLFLRVTGRRGDGYHELDSVFLPVSLADEIRVEIRAADDPSVTVNCNVAGTRQEPEQPGGTRRALIH